MEESPFQVTVYGHDFTKKGDVLPSGIVVTVRHNQQSSLAVVVPAHTPRDGVLIQTPRLDTLVADAGARVVVSYKGERLFSGVKDSWVETITDGEAQYTFQFRDDWRIFEDWLAWPVPSSAITNQSAAEYSVQTSTDAETIVKNLVIANKGRHTPTMTVATNLHRGGNLTVQNRFHPLTDRLVPLLDAAGIGVTVQQSGAGVLLDVYATRTFPRSLTQDSGILGDLSISWQAPNPTRVIVGGPGEATARVFTQVTSTVDETALGYDVEAFLDATDTASDAERVVRGTQYLLEHSTKVGVTAALSETPSFYFLPSGVGGAVRLGDKLTIVTTLNQSYTDVLRSVTLSYSADNGLTVTPQVGERTDSDKNILNLIGNMAKAVRQNGLR